MFLYQSCRVHDSTADARYLVIPMRPAGTDLLSEEQLRALITRDSMIGVSVLDSYVAVEPASDSLSSASVSSAQG